MKNIGYEDLQDLEFTVEYSTKDKTWYAEVNKWGVMKKGMHETRPQLALENLCEAIFSVIKNT